ncbi:MAG: hypothetical protein HWE14_08205 [Flavobacteriia bacterium]|nr:hypothetical protein [Flavobacteriia bacterium]
MNYNPIRWMRKMKLPIRGLFLELLVVFLGVYLAFYLSNYSEQEKNEAQQVKIMSSLKIELEGMRFRFPGYSGYQKNKVAEWKEALSENRVIDYYNYQFIQPQYDYHALEYALQTRETEVVPFDVFQSLLAIQRNVERLREAEDRMTEVSLLHRNLPSEYELSENEQLSRFADNLFHFSKFIRFAETRAQALEQLSALALEALDFINKELPEQVRHDIEIELIQDYMGSLNQIPPMEFALPQISKFFPEIPEGEIEEVLREYYSR